MSESNKKKRNISRTVIRRLPKYYRYLADLLEKDVTRISSGELSKLVGFTASQIRQDLNNFGGFGQQGYGYNVEELFNEVSKILGLDKKYKTIIMGAGNLGRAIANYKGFESSGFELYALFDKKTELIGEKIRNIEVKDSETMIDYVEENNIEIAIMTLPRESAQKVAEELIEAGVKGFWNFAPIDLIVPDDIIVEDVRLNESLYTLSYFLKE